MAAISQETPLPSIQPPPGLFDPELGSMAFCWAQLEDTAPKRTGYSGLEFRVYAAKRGSWPEPPEGGTPNGGIVEMRRVLFSSEILPSISYSSLSAF
jgi:hypothetical protein